MNINQYKNFMDDILVNKIEVDELIKKNSKKIIKRRFMKSIFIFIITCVLVFNQIPLTNFSDSTSTITIRAYAAGEEIQLTKNYIDIDTNATPINGGSSSNYSYKNYNLYFKCEGNNINTITYTCSEQPININNRLIAPIYFVENISVPVDEYTMWRNDSSFIFGYIVEDTAHITKLIGNSYTVNYGDQNNKQYGLILASKVGKDGDFQILDTIIKITITLKDGSIQHKKLIINTTEDSGIKIRILN